MAIVKVTYTKNRIAAKKTVRHLSHRPDKHGKRTTRELFGPDGQLSKLQAYRLIDQARTGTTFFRIVISPDPSQEDTNRDLYLSDITIATPAAVGSHPPWVRILLTHRSLVKQTLALSQNTKKAPMSLKETRNSISN